MRSYGPAAPIDCPYATGARENTRTSAISARHAVAVMHANASTAAAQSAASQGSGQDDSWLSTAGDFLKGVGEGGTLAPPAAILNAVSDVLGGVAITRLLLSPARVLAAAHNR